MRILRLASVCVVAGAAAFSALTGCLNDIGTGGTSSSSSSSSTSSSGTIGDSGVSGAEQACLDTVSAFATAETRCGLGDYTTERNALIQTLANGNCANVSIREETQLRSTCIPSFTTISCDDLTNDRLDPSCAMQIIPNQ